MSDISHPRLRRLMQKHHSFLYKLFIGNGRKNRHSLGSATKQQVHLLLRVLYCLSAGHIPISREDFGEIVRRKKRLLLARLKSQSLVLRKKKTFLEKRKYILQYSSVYPFLLHPLFYPM